MIALLLLLVALIALELLGRRARLNRERRATLADLARTRPMGRAEVIARHHADRAARRQRAGLPAERGNTP